MAFAQTTINSFSYEGRLYDTAGSPIVSASAVFRLEIYSPGGGCLLYQEVHSGVNLSSTNTHEQGVFGLKVGDGVRGGNDPGLNFADIFKNSALLVGYAGCNYTPGASDIRQMRVSVDAGGGYEILSPDFDILSSPGAMVAQSLQGRAASDFIQVNGLVNQANIATLVSGGDAAGLHHHDSRYAQLGSSAAQNFGSGNLITNGQVAIGTATPTAGVELHVRDAAAAATVKLEGAAAAGSRILFNDAAVERASIATEGGTAALVFSTDGTTAMRIDADQNLSLSGALFVGGLIRPGPIPSAALETTMQTALSGTCGAGCSGGTWYRTDTGEYRIWDNTRGTRTIAVYEGAPTANQILQWDGVRWVPATAAMVDATKVPLAGGIMTGALTVPNVTVTSTLSAGSLGVSGINATSMTVNSVATGTLSATSMTVTLSPTASNDVTNKMYTDTHLAGRSIPIPTAGQDNQALRWNNTLVEWQFFAPTSLGSAASQATANSDVPSCSAGQKLQMSVGPIHTYTCVQELGNATQLQGFALHNASPTGGQVLTWNSGNSRWEATTPVALGVVTFNGRSGAVVSAANDYTWAQIDKTTSSLADLATRNAGDLNAGTLADAQLSTNVVLKNQSNVFTGGAQVFTGNVTVTGQLQATGAIGIGTASPTCLPGNNGLIWFDASVQGFRYCENSSARDLSAYRLADRQVASTAPTTDQYLRYDGTQWAPGNLSLPTSIVGSAEIANETVQSQDILDGTITNADISATANIAASKIAGLGSMATQNSGSVTITGGNVTGLSQLGTVTLVAGNLSVGAAAMQLSNIPFYLTSASDAQVSLYSANTYSSRLVLDSVVGQSMIEMGNSAELMLRNYSGNVRIESNADSSIQAGTPGFGTRIDMPAATNVLDVNSARIAEVGDAIDAYDAVNVRTDNGPENEPKIVYISSTEIQIQGQKPGFMPVIRLPSGNVWRPAVYPSFTIPSGTAWRYFYVVRTGGNTFTILGAPDAPQEISYGTYGAVEGRFVGAAFMLAGAFLPFKQVRNEFYLSINHNFSSLLSGTINAANNMYPKSAMSVDASMIANFSSGTSITCYNRYFLTGDSMYPSLNFSINKDSVAGQAVYFEQRGRVFLNVTTVNNPTLSLANAGGTCNLLAFKTSIISYTDGYL
ncbi:MAG: hypothetical protein AB7N80_13340 [Bdellovibrionales bacterium]